MKRFTKTFLVALGFGALLAGCQPEPVGPDGRGDKHIAGAVSEEHPNLDTICAYADSVYLRATNGSYYMDICNDGDIFNPVAIPCVGPQPKWGWFVMYNGYEYTYDSVSGTTDSIHQLDVDFSLAPGVVCDFTNWLFTVNNTILLDQNTNAPIVGTDWSNLVVNPARNEWRVRTPVSDLPSPCFDLACRINAVQLSLFGDPIPGTEVTLWAINSHWNQTGHPAASNNEFAIHYCPLACLENVTTGCPTTETSTECEVVYKGITCPGNTLNTTTLTASNAGITGPATYAWSNGMNTQSITVTPNVTTSYTVTVTSGACTIRVVTFNVNVIDAGCTITSPSTANEAEFCTYNLDVRYNQTFNIRDYVRMKNGGAVNWNNVRFTYTAAGANDQTNPANWKLTQFNAGQSVTVTAQDAAAGRGNKGNGEYRIYVYRLGQTSYDDHMTIRVSNSRASSVQSSKCSANGGNCGNGGSGSSNNGSGGSSNGSGGSGSGSGGSSNGGSGNGTTSGVKICHVPPGNPNGAATICVSYAQLAQHLTGVCGGPSNTGNGGSGSGNGGSGSGSGNGGSGNSGSGHNGSGNGGSGSGGSCSHHGGSTGCGTGNGTGHAGDYLGACNSNPCN